VSRSRYALFLLATILLLAGGLPQDPVAAGPPQPADKLAPWVIEQTQNGAPVEFLVVLAQQADVSPAEHLPTKLERGRYVRDILWNTAESTQQPMRQWLAARGIAYRSYYIVNLLVVKATETWRWRWRRAPR